MKSDKSTDTVLGLVNYASTDEIKSEEIHQIYDKWADQYEQVSMTARLSEWCMF